MPELPEVEVTKRGVAPHLLGCKVTSVRLGKPLRWALGCDPRALVGAKMIGLTRRGKYLLLEMDRGWLLIHLGMSGSLQWHQTTGELGPHDHFSLSTHRGELRLHDPRRFGAVIFSTSLQDQLPAKLLGGLGVEPLRPFENPLGLVSSLRLRKSAIKQVLLAGDWIVGVGNIYASEALFHAGIRPTTPANRLSRARALRLMDAIRMVLSRAVELGGSTLQDFVHADGHSGQFQEHTMVYGRDALPCRICSARIKRVIQGQRSSYYCPKCQKS